jgi:hypothetical protein
MSNRSFFRRAASLPPAALGWLVPLLLGLAAAGMLLAGMGAGRAALAQDEPYLAITAYPVFAYPGQPVSVTLTWKNAPTDGRYKLRLQLENRLQSPHFYYFPPDVTAYAAAETRTIAFTIPPDAGPRVGCRFVAAFISTTVEWGDVLVADYGPADVTLESDPPTGWTAGRFRLVGPEGGVFLDPAGQPFYAQGMTYAYGPNAISPTLTAADVISRLNQMKALGFNTVNLYPRSGFNTEAGLRADFLPEILSWADHNRVAVYARVGYRDMPEFPNFMDAQYRQQAKASLDAVLELARPHPSLLAVDLDQRWLFDVDWQGAGRFGTPRWMTHTLAYLPTWLADRFGAIDELNEVWGKDYLTFADVLGDAEIIRDGRVVDLDRRPWRLELGRIHVVGHGRFYGRGRCLCARSGSRSSLHLHQRPRRGHSLSPLQPGQQRRRLYLAGTL